MAQKKKSMSLASFSLFLLVLSLNLAETLAAEILQTWCVAKPSSSDSLLRDNIDFACDHVQDECNPIKLGNSNPCYNPNTPIHHASFAMNAYYQKRERHQWNCNFENSGLISITNPSYAGCIYKGGATLMDLSSAGKWCVATPSANNEMLQESIDYACSHVDCSIIKFGGSCYDPSNLISHASVAMNLYYQANGKLDPSCDFKGTGLIVTNDPREISRLMSARIDEESLIHAPIPRRTWCIAKPSASEEALREAIDYACRMTDCGPVHAAGICFQPDTKANHASFAINSYYQTRGANKWNCDFSNTGLIALTDPSYGCCQFEGSVPKTPLPKQQDTWCVAKPGTPDKMLQANIDYACGELGDCSDIQEQGSCFFPNTLISHASVIMNLYYKTVGKYRCNFNNTGVIVVSNPDSGECLYV